MDTKSYVKKVQQKNWDIPRDKNIWLENIAMKLLGRQAETLGDVE